MFDTFIEISIIEGGVEINGARFKFYNDDNSQYILVQDRIKFKILFYVVNVNKK